MALFSNLRGTIETIFRIGIGGPQWKANSGQLEGRDSADAAFVNVRGLDPVIDDDLVTKRYFEANLFVLSVTSTASATYNVVASDQLIRLTAAGAQTVNLPAATGSGRIIYIKRAVAGGPSKTIDADGTDTIDGSGTEVLNQPYESATLVDGASGQWDVI